MSAMTPGQATYLAWHRKRYPGQPSELGAMRWDNYGDHARSCWEAAAEAAIAARQPQPAPGELRASLESLAAFWVREYAAKDNWADVCAGQLLDVLGATGTTPEPFRLRLPKPTPEQIAAWRAELDDPQPHVPFPMEDPQPAPGDASGLLEPLHALAAKWDATAARNQRNGQSLVDQGDEYGSEGLAIAEALGACVVDLRAVLADAPEQPAPGPAAATVAIEQISRMCQRPKETAGTTQGVVVNGERLAGLILAVIKAAGLEGK